MPEISKPDLATGDELGLREQNRLEKLQRIKIAARELFSEKGYDAATTRDIAKRARISMGTLFNYADDKRDLIFLVMRDDLNEVFSQTQSAVDFKLSPLDQLIRTFECYYRYFAKSMVLSRILLRELTFYNTGKLAAYFYATRLQLIQFIKLLVIHAQQAGQIRSDEDPELIARCIFFIYSGSVRWWIAEKAPKQKSGLIDLRKLLAPYLAGLA